MTTEPIGSLPFSQGLVGGVPFKVASLQSAARWLVEMAIPHRLPVNVRLANAYNVALASEDHEYRRLLSEEGINFPDGTPVVWFLKASRRGREAGRVRGPSFFHETIRLGQEKRIRHFLLGSTPETLTRLEAELLRRYPDVIIVGSYSPPFAPIDEHYIQDCATKAAEGDSDVVWVGLGTPKQDILGTALAARLGKPTVNVGAAFDFTAGTVREAPRMLQQSGFEWLYRLFAEPRRLWRRYLFGNLRFLSVAAAGLAKGDRQEVRIR